MKFNMNNIHFKIWRSQLITLLLFLLILIIADLTIVEAVKSEFIYDQLDEASGSRRHPDDDKRERQSLNSSTWIPHFSIEWSGDKAKLNIDKTTDALYMNVTDDNVLNLIVEELDGYKEVAVTGKVTADTYTIQYLAYPIDGNIAEDTMVYFEVSAPSKLFRASNLLILLSLVVISFFTSRYSANNISKPIKELEAFADEISKRNWSAKVPISKTEEIMHLSHSLDEMRTTLKSLEIRDRKFLQSASHDLKTPVMIIKGYAQALKDGININSKDDASEIIIAESDKLERRITQLLRLNTVDHTLEHTDNRELIRIDRLLKSLVNRFSVVKSDITWDMNLNTLEILGDANALLIAFENLIENQIRFAKSRIYIKCQPGDPNIIEIGNDGPHFVTDNTETLFDPYQKEMDGNFGLGLAIVRQVFTAHHGTVSAHNADNGIYFRVTLPRGSETSVNDD